MKKQCIQNSLLTSILNVKLHCLLAVSFVTELSSAVLKISCFSTQSHTFPKELNLMVIEIITNKIFVSIFLIQVAVPTQHRPKMTLNFLDQVHKFPQVKNKCKIFPSVSPTPLDPVGIKCINFPTWGNLCTWSNFFIRKKSVFSNFLFQWLSSIKMYAQA